MTLAYTHDAEQRFLRTPKTVRLSIRLKSWCLGSSPGLVVRSTPPFGASRAISPSGADIPETSRWLPAHLLDLLLGRHDRLALQLADHMRMTSRASSPANAHPHRQLRIRKVGMDLHATRDAGHTAAAARSPRPRAQRARPAGTGSSSRTSATAYRPVEGTTAGRGQYEREHAVAQPPADATWKIPRPAGSVPPGRSGRTASGATRRALTAGTCDQRDAPDLGLDLRQTRRGQAVLPDRRALRDRDRAEQGRLALNPIDDADDQVEPVVEEDGRLLIYAVDVQPVGVPAHGHPIPKGGVARVGERPVDRCARTARRSPGRRL